MTDYEPLIEGVIQQEKSIIGLVALTKARQVEGLEIDDDGNVESLNGDGQEIFSDLVESYKSVVGEAVMTAIRQYESEEGELPPNLEDALEELL